MTKAKIKKKLSLKEALARLRAINKEFEEETVDIEKGMQRLKEGLKLARFLKERLTKIENEIQEIKEEFEGD